MEIINNQLQVAKIKLAYILSLVMGLSLLTFALTGSFFSFEKYIMLFLAIFLLLFFIYLVIIKPEYVYFAEVKNKIQIKNYPARPVLRSYKAYEIDLSAFHHFKISKSFFNQKAELILTIKTKKGEGDYPPLSLSALSKKELIKLSKYLSSVSKKRTL